MRWSAQKNRYNNDDDNNHITYNPKKSYEKSSENKNTIHFSRARDEKTLTQFECKDTLVS